jgi:hypothetical protein
MRSVSFFFRISFLRPPCFGSVGLDLDVHPPLHHGFLEITCVCIVSTADRFGKKGVCGVIEGPG